MVMDKKWLLLFALFLVFITPVKGVNFFDVHTNYTVQPDQNITIWGGVYNYSNASQGFEGFVVVANLTTSPTKENGTITTGSDGNFSISINTTGLGGVSKVSVSSNFSSKVLPFIITNITSATVEFVENLPPFAVGGQIITKVTCSGDNKANQTITGDIFAADGANVSWGHNTSTTNDAGVAYINFTIASAATTGRYMLSVDNDAGFAFFMIKRYTVGVKTEDDTGAAKNTLSPGDNVTIESKIIDADGDPRNVTSVTCDFIDENETIASVNGIIYTDGTYQCNLTTSNTAQSYDVKVTATDSAGTEEVYTKFSTKAFSVRLAPRTGGMFFHEFGSKKSFTIGSPIEMDVVVVNVSSGEIIPPSASTYGCDGVNITVEDVWYAPNGTSFNSTVSDDSLNSGMYMMSSACFYRFSLGELTGIYGIKLNLTIGSETITGQGYFIINKYLLKVEPATMFGGMDFHVTLKPEDNASFKLSVYNLTDGSEMGIGNITDAYFTKIMPLSFTGEMTELSTSDVPWTFKNETDDKYLNVILPSNTGPQLLMATATVAGENVTGEAFYIAKYIMGFASPSGNMFGGPGGENEGEQMGPGEGGGGPEGGEIKCTSGTVEFSAQTMDASTMQAVKGVTFLNIIEAREEMTGKDVSSCFSSTRGISDTSGQATFNFTFLGGAGCTGLSGPYFVMFNVSWKNVTDQIPTFFMCRQFSFWASTEPWDAQPTSTLEINVTNVTDTQNSSYIVSGGNVSIVRLMNFNPNMGGKVLTANTSSTNWKANITREGGNQGGFRGSIRISPSDFSLERWPNGFYDGSFQVCDNATGNEACDSNFFGFAILPFRAYTTWWKGTYQVSTYTSGDVVNTTIYAQTNITPDADNRTHQNTTHHPGFIVKFMNPMSMQKYDTSWFLATNATGDADVSSMPGGGWQKFNVSMKLPTNIKKGWYMGFLTINNTNSETVDIFVDFKIQNYVVGIPHKEKLQAETGATCCETYNMNCTFGNVSEECICNNEIEPTTGWNSTQWEYARDKWELNVSDGGDSEVCLYKHFNLSAEMSSSGASDSNNVNLGALVYDNVTTKIFIMKNHTDNVTSRIFEGDNINGTKQYLWAIEGPWYSTFANATNLTTMSNDGLVEEMWGWAGRFQANKTFKIPFIVIKGDAAQANINVTIGNIFELEVEGFGVKDYLDTKYYNTTPGGVCGNVTDANGIAFVPLKISEIGKFKPFWKLDTTSKDTGSFDKSPVVDVSAFNAFGDIITLYPQTSKNVTLYATAATPYGTDYQPNNASTFYNGTFTETLTDQFYSDDVADTWYYMLANASSSYNMLYIDNDTTYDGDFFGSIDISGGEEWRTDLYGTQMSLAELVVNDSGNNQATVTFYTERSNQEQYDVTSATEKIPVKFCVEDFEYNGMNTTINLTWVNWYQSFMPTSKTVGLYNLTTGERMNSTTTSSLFNEGCVCVEILPDDADGNAYEWEEGQTEVKGTVTQLNTTGHETGTQQEIWVGQVNYWTS